MATASWIVPGPQQVDLAGVSLVRLQLIGGRAEVVAAPGGGVHVEVRSVSGHPLEIRQDGTTLSIGYPFLGWDGWLKRLHSYRAKDTADVRISVPAGTGIKAGTVLADVSLEGISEDVSIGTASGAVRLRGGHGSAEVKAVSGGVSVEDHDGAVRVNTVSGAVAARGALPRVEVSTVSGAIAVENSLASSVVNVNAVSSGVSVGLPEGAGLVLVARTVSGKVLVDGVDRRTAGITSIEEKADQDTACWLSANTVSGSVEVRRGAAPEPVQDAPVQDAPVQDAPVQDPPPAG